MAEHTKLPWVSFIVEAVNNYAALKEANEALVEALEYALTELRNSNPVKQGRLDVRDILEKGDAALSKARG